MHADALPLPRLRVGVLASHPIQYQAPIFRALAQRCDLTVLFAHRQSRQAQAEAGFGVPFDWDVDLLDGYPHDFLANVSRSPGTDRFLGCDTPAVADAIAAGRFDAFLVMGWNLKAYWQAVRACHAHHVPVLVRGDSQLVTQRGAVKRALKRIAYPLLLRQFDGALYVGQRNRDYLLHYGVPPRRLHFAPHSIDVDAFARAAAGADAAAMRASWGVAQGDAVLLFAGKLVAGKRPADLLEAAARLRREGRGLHVVWAGDGPERAALATRATGLGVPVTALGFQNQSRMPAVYRAADLAVLPSESETWGLVANEALACGTRFVVTEACGCVPDLVRDGAGAAFPVGDVPALARSIAGLLAQPADPRSLAALSAAYSPQATAAGILQGAQAVAASTPHGARP
jgi:glycosyltransferase involved in cell wall biosynthesis